MSKDEEEMIKNMNEADGGRKHECFLEQGRCTFPVKVDYLQ